MTKRHPLENQHWSGFTLLTCPVPKERSVHLSFRTFQRKGHPHPALSRSTPGHFPSGLSPKPSCTLGESTCLSPNSTLALPSWRAKAFPSFAGSADGIRMKSLLPVKSSPITIISAGAPTSDSRMGVVRLDCRPQPPARPNPFGASWKHIEFVGFPVWLR